MYILMILLFCGQVLGVVTVQSNTKMDTKVQLSIKFSGNLANFNNNVLKDGLWYENTMFYYKDKDSLNNEQDVLDAIAHEYEMLKKKIIYAINTAIIDAAVAKHGRDHAWTEIDKHAKSPELNPY